jgi:hypothetical protein
MSCGALPAIDKRVCSFERWLAIHLDSIADDGHAQIIRRFTTWEVLPRLQARAERKPLAPGARSYADAQVLRATAKPAAEAAGTFSRYAPGDTGGRQSVLGILALLAVGVTDLPRFTTASAYTPA